jgi:hypothetical protein
MKYMDCPRQYIGQTGRSFKTRFKEHIRAIKHNTDSSTYSQHILNIGHKHGNMEDTMDIINVTHKGRFMNTIEKFHIYCAQKEDVHMNEVLLIHIIQSSTQYMNTKKVDSCEMKKST